MSQEIKVQRKSKDKTENRIANKESIFAIIYFIGYITYLFFSQENELLHWLTLVIVPFFLIFFYHKKLRKKFTFSETLASVGISKTNWNNGIGLAAFTGIGISLIQLIISESAQQIVEIFTSGKFVVLMPLAFVMLLLTAGFTEEFFFRGVLQTRLQSLFKSKILAIIITAICFGIYHLPYALLSPNWPTFGNFGAALGSSLLEGSIAGLIFGWLYVKSENNLIACVIAHSMMDVLPSMTMIHFGG